MSSEPSIDARGLGKAYPIYRRPEDRLKQLLWGRWRRYYDEFWAVRDVDLKVMRGETLGIIGRNGSGKSTLLQMVCGTLRPSTGEVRVKGRVAAMLELGSGFNPEFTGRENMRLAAAVLGLSREEIDARFEAIADFADIGTFMDQPLKHYSSGMHARLAFAVCANVDADVLIVDEVLSVGDAAFQQKCMRFLNRFRLHGTLLFVSHDNAAIVKLCDRVLWLEQGSVRGQGEAKEMCRLYLAAQAEETADDSGRFQISNRKVQPVLNAMPEPTIPVPAVDLSEILDFDPDDDWNETGAATIESVVLLTADGTTLPVAKGGEEVELRIGCRAARDIVRPAIAFVWRDRLGQVLFADDTLACRGDGLNAKEGCVFAASFAFRLPYLSSGAYSVEAFLFESGPEFTPLVRKRDSLIVHVQSRHIFQQGLLNIAMISVSLHNLSRAVFRDGDAKSMRPVADGTARRVVTGISA